MFHEPFWHWSVPLLVKYRATCLRLCNIGNFLYFQVSLLMTVFVGWAIHQKVLSVFVGCINNSDSEILAALQIQH